MNLKIATFLLFTFFFMNYNLSQELSVAGGGTTKDWANLKRFALSLIHI